MGFKNKMSPYTMIALFAIIGIMGEQVIARFYRYPMTATMIALNVIVFLMINGGQLNTKDLSLSVYRVKNHKEYYRIITSAFTQQEPLHLICNIASLYNIGTVIERTITTKLYVIVYFVIMIGGGLLSLAIRAKKSPLTSSIGASGVICGLLGIYLVIAFAIRGFAGLRSILPCILILVGMTYYRKIDSIGHFAGLAVGILCGIWILILMMAL